VNDAQQSLQFHRTLNEQLKVTVDELTAFNNQVIAKVRDLSKNRSDEQLKQLLHDLERAVHFEQTRYSQLERLYT